MNELPLRLGEVLLARAKGMCAFCGTEYSVGTPIIIHQFTPEFLAWVTTEPCLKEAKS